MSEVCTTSSPTASARHFVCDWVTLTPFIPLSFLDAEKPKCFHTSHLKLGGEMSNFALSLGFPSLPSRRLPLSPLYWLRCDTYRPDILHFGYSDTTKLTILIVSWQIFLAGACHKSRYFHIVCCVWIFINNDGKVWRPSVILTDSNSEYCWLSGWCVKWSSYWLQSCLYVEFALTLAIAKCIWVSFLKGATIVMALVNAVK